MTRDDIIKLANQAGIFFQCHVGIDGRKRITTEGSQNIDKLVRLVELAVAAEREACAKVCDERAVMFAGSSAILEVENEVIAAAIRARGVE